MLPLLDQSCEVIFLLLALSYLVPHLLGLFSQVLNRTLLGSHLATLFFRAV